jgi:NTE family protein
LHSIAAVERTRPQSLLELRSLYERIIESYHQAGYDLARIEKAGLDEESGHLTLDLDEGEIVGISVTGNKKTRAWVVTSYLPLKAGQLYSQHLAQRGVRNIYASGLFESVTLKLSERSGGVWVTIDVKEKDFAYAKLGGRYHETFHPEAYLKLGYANIGGTGNELSVYGRFSEYRKRFRMRLSADRVFRSMVTYSIDAYYTNDRVTQFDGDQEIGHRSDKRFGVSASIGQQLARFGLFDVTGRYERVRYKYSGEETATDRTVASLAFDLSYDTKNRFVFPTSGRASHLSFEIASDVLGAEEVYQKSQGYLESYNQILSRLNFHPRVAIGLSKDGLPVYDLFYIGGTRQFMGTITDQLFGDKYFLVNLELRLGPYYGLYLSGRYDMGEVFSRFEQVRVRQLRHAFGFSLALETPLGPFSISYGRAQDKYDSIYLNLGYDFQD